MNMDTQSQTKKMPVFVTQPIRGDSVYRFIELLYIMTEKELYARYKYTVFGFFWIVVNPVLQMIVIGFVFQFFVRLTIDHYFHHLFIGLLVWQFFSLSLTKATPSIVYERTLIKKAPFPRSVIPLSIILSNLVHFFIALVLFIPIVVVVQQLSLYSVLFVIFGLLLLLMFTIGLSLFTTALNVRFRDVNFFVQAVLIIWFYATPIVYSLSMIPSHAVWLWQANPMTSVLLLFHHGFLRETLPTPAMLLGNMSIIVLMFVLGVYIFRNESKNFDDWV